MARTRKSKKAKPQVTSVDDSGRSAIDQAVTEHVESEYPEGMKMVGAVPDDVAEEITPVNTSEQVGEDENATDQLDTEISTEAESCQDTETANVSEPSEEGEETDSGDNYPSFGEMIAALETFLESDPAVSYFQLKLARHKPGHWIIYQGSRGNKWATLIDCVSDKSYFSRTGLLRALLQLNGATKDYQKVLYQYFKNFQLVTGRRKLG